MTAPTLRQIALNTKRQLESGASEHEIIRGIAAELLVSKRQYLVDELLQHLAVLYESENSLSCVAIEIPHRLPLAAQRHLEQQLRSVFAAKELQATYRIDPTLLSGFRAKSPSRQLDMSGQYLLNQLTEEL